MKHSTVGMRPGMARGVGRTAWLAVVAALAWAGPASAQSTREAPAEASPDSVSGGVEMTLDAAVRRAMERSPRVRQAQLALKEAEGQVDEAWGELYPSVDVSADWTRNVTPSVNFLPAIIFNPDAGPDDLIPVQFGADNTWTMNLNVDQALFRAGVFVGVGAASQYKDLQEEVVRGARQSVATSVRQRYYDVLLAQEQVRLTENSVERVRQSLKETQAMNEAGLTSDYDVLRLQVELANLEPNLRRARNQVSAARRELGVLLAVDQPDTLRVAGSLATMDLSSPEGNGPANRQILQFASVERPAAADADALVALAEQNRSDVLQAELTEDLRKAQLRVEQGSYLPEISLFGNYSINAQQNGAPDFFGRPRAYGRRVGIRVTLPVFNGFAREAKVGERKAALESAQSQTRLTKDEAESQVRTLVDQADEARQRAEAQHLAVGQAQRGFEIAEAQYKEGLSSQLELTDAEVALRQTEFNYAQAVYDYLVARSRLDQAVGRVPEVGSRGGEG